MAVHFNDITLTWDGKKYKIAARSVLAVIATIEDIITIDELVKVAKRKTVPLSRVAMAYGAALRFAGAEVDDEDVYVGLFADGGSTAAASVQGLLSMMIPNTPEVKKEKPGKQVSSSD